MNPGLTFALARVGIFIACAVPALVFLPQDMNTLLKLMIALVVSAVLSFVLLRGLREQVAQRMSDNARRRSEEKERLRAALDGKDETPARSSHESQG